MSHLVGGSTAESGYYLNTRSLAVVGLPVDGKLPGSDGDEFVRVPWALLLIAAPLIGGAMVLAFPVLGLATMAVGLARRLAGTAGRGLGDLAATVAAGQSVGEAHLTGKRGKGEPGRGRKVGDLEKEVARRRRQRGRR